jgi:hypothetical protein
MSRPVLWYCRSCGCPLGRIVDGDLQVFGHATVKPGSVVVHCLCGAARIWYHGRESECSESAVIGPRP